MKFRNLLYIVVCVILSACTLPFERYSYSPYSSQQTELSNTETKVGDLTGGMEGFGAVMTETSTPFQPVPTFESSAASPEIESRQSASITPSVSLTVSVFGSPSVTSSATNTATPAQSVTSSPGITVTSINVTALPSITLVNSPTRTTTTTSPSTFTPSSTLFPSTRTFTFTPSLTQTSTASRTSTYTLQPTTPGTSVYTPTYTVVQPTLTATRTNTASPTSTNTRTITFTYTATIVIPTQPPPTATFTRTATLIPASATPSACNPVQNSGFESQVISLINDERAKVGVAPLSNQSQLGNAARGHSQDMACNKFFSHTGSDGSSFTTRISRAGYSYSAAAENIAAGYGDPASVVAGWMGSQGHKENMLNPAYTEVGIGYIYVSGSPYGVYWTADFGRP